jgi:N-acetylmuramic acid 6-phosphate etherase
MGLPPREGQKLFEYLKKLVTEQANPNSLNLDRMSTSEILNLINAEDATVAPAVNKELPHITEAVELVYQALKTGGRLIYIGAGTSGRLGVLDAAECPPTFGADPKQIIGLIAGGAPTLIRSAEGIEDDVDAGERDIVNAQVCDKDVVMGLTSSNRTPYVIAGLNKAKLLKAKTILFSCNPRDDNSNDYDLYITPIVGPEVLAGSTRMKAALAEKMTLTMITTTAMVKLGKVYKNMMVDLQATSQKLVERSKAVLMKTLECDYYTAASLLKKADGHVKTAIVMALRGCDKKAAIELLAQHDGIVYRAIE